MWNGCLCTTPGSCCKYWNKMYGIKQNNTVGAVSKYNRKFVERSKKSWNRVIGNVNMTEYINMNEWTRNSRVVDVASVETSFPAVQYYDVMNMSSGNGNIPWNLAQYFITLYMRWYNILYHTHFSFTFQRKTYLMLVNTEILLK